MDNVTVFEVKSISEITALPCMKNLGLILAQNQLAFNGEYGYHDSTTGKQYKIILVK